MRWLPALGGISALLASFAGCGSSSDSPGAAACAPLPTAAATPFEDATQALGIDFVHHYATNYCDTGDFVGPGTCVFDMDGDGDLDIYFVDRAGHSNRLYRNDGAKFTDVTVASGTAATSDDSMGCLAFDYDGDGDSDLLVTNAGPDRLFRNEGGVFTDVTAEAGPIDNAFTTSATAGDIDGDGDLDLAIAGYVDPTTCKPGCPPLPLSCTPVRNFLFENQNGKFVDVSAARGIDPGLLEPTFVALLFDLDRDGDLDLYFGNDMGRAFPDRMYMNDGSGHFTDKAVALGLDDTGSDTMGVDVGDFNFDGIPDITTTVSIGYPTRLFSCADGTKPCKRSDLGESSSPYVKWGVGFVDFDQDMALDLFWATGAIDFSKQTRNQLYFNDRGEFVEYVPKTGEALADVHESRGVAFGDLDGDGDVDVVVARGGGAPQVLMNHAAKGHYLIVALDSLSAGARVTVTAGGKTLTEQALIGGSFLGSSDPRLYFGLGDACSADVTVRWMDGKEKTLPGVAASTVLRVERP